MKIKKSHANINISLLILILSLTVAGTLNQSFTPQYKLETPKSSADEITIVTPENKTYTEPMSGYYPATYGFENDEDGTIPEEWEEVKGDPIMFNEIITELDGHKKVLHMDKGNTYGDNNNINQYFKSVQEYGTIEFWARTTDVSQESAWHLKSGTFNQYAIAGVRMMDNTFQFMNSTEWYPVSYTANNNQWYHLRIQFECGTGNHYGLAQYKWRFFVNGVQFGDFQMISSHSNVSHIIIHQNWRYDNFHMYTDAVGYSWDSNYNVGDNLNEGILFSYENTTNLDWKGYSLDGQTNKTIMGNTTIPVLDDGLHSIHMFGNDSMGTMYESNLRYFTVDTNPYLNIVTPENKMYTEPMSGYYPATYGFENEMDGTSRTDIAYVDSTNSIQSNCYVDIVNNFQGHNKVLRIYDANTAGNAEARNHFTSPQQSGTIEWWWNTSASGSNMIDYLFYEGTLGTGVGKLKMQDGDYLDMQDNIVQSYVANQWYHHKMIFDAVTDTYDWYIDGVLRVDDGNFTTAVSNIGTMNINADWANIGSCYVDAVGYSWDPDYNIGDNLNEGLLLSYANTTNLDWKGYSLNGANNRTILGNTTVPMPSDGVYSIQVFGNDTLGTMYESNLRYFSVNTAPPEITISSPSDSDIFGTSAPEYDISITGLYDTIWYTLDGGATNITAGGLTGTIDQNEWDKLTDGIVTIIIYVNSTAGMGNAQVQVIKQISSEPPIPPRIPGYNLIALIGVTLAVTLILVKRKLKK